MIHTDTRPQNVSQIGAPLKFALRHLTPAAQRSSDTGSCNLGPIGHVGEIGDGEFSRSGTLGCCKTRYSHGEDPDKTILVRQNAFCSVLGPITCALRSAVR